MALQHYEAAVNILQAQLKGKLRADGESSKDEAELKTSIVRALIAEVEIWMDPSYDLWYVPYSQAGSKSHVYLSFEPEAPKTCEDLLALALSTDPGNPEALQSLASVRMSQERPEDAKKCLEEVWAVLKDLDLGMLATIVAGGVLTMPSQMILNCRRYLYAWRWSGSSLNFRYIPLLCWCCTALHRATIRKWKPGISKGGAFT